MGHGFPPALADRHAVARYGIAVDRLVDNAVRPVGRAPDKSPIATLKAPAPAVIGELRGQRPMGPIVLRYDHQAGGVFVEPVHDAGTPHAADAGQALPAMGDQRIDQRAGPMAGRRMDHKAAGLIDDDDIVVLIDDIERDRFRLRVWPAPAAARQQDLVARIDVEARIADRAPVERYGAVLESAP